MAGETVLTVVGNLTARPELRFTQTGRPVSNLTVASTPRYFNRDTGEWQDKETLFQRVVVWGPDGEAAAEQLDKGNKVIVTGNLVQRKYTTSEGVEASSTELHAEDVGLVVRKIANAAPAPVGTPDGPPF